MILLVGLFTGEVAILVAGVDIKRYLLVVVLNQNRILLLVEDFVLAIRIYCRVATGKGITTE